MEVEDIHASKRSRVGNGDGDGRANAAASGAAAAAGLGQEQRQLLDDDEEDGQGRSLLAGGGGGDVSAVGVRALRPWNQHSTASRIYRVSRASGGKDRHSKVMTAKGLRDRRVRLSVSTAIQFYDLQDRLGCDQPSKAIEWLIKAAAAAISDLPSLDGAFPEQPSPGRLPGDEEKPAGGGDEDEDQDEDGDVSQLQYPNHHQLQCQQEEQQTHRRPQQQRLSLTKSTCSSTSETSRGSVLSLSRSEIRVKARERARERTATARDKEEDMDEDVAHVASAVHHQSVNPNPTSQSSFTELLTGGGHQNHHPQHNHGPASSVAQANPAAIHKQLRQLPSSATTTTADYFGGQVGFLGTGQKSHQPTIFPAQTHFAGNSSSMGMVPFNIAAAAADHPEMQQHYIQEHFIPIAVTGAGGDYINFSISSGFNRGTLQSNSPSPLLHHHLQMFSSPVDGSNLPFFLGAAAAAQAASASGEGQLPTGFDSRLQLCYRHPDLKGKGKN